ncbi:MAG: TonB-dependent receptor domain-containing protein, partial [Pseudomonadales bacterium]
LADPGCGINNGAGGTDKNQPDSFRSGIRNAAGTTCSFEFSQFWDHLPALEGFTGWAFVEHAFNDHLVFEGQFSFSRHQSFGRGSPSNPGGRIGELGIIPGSHPGNPFTAMADRGNGLEPLHALDLDGDGIPDRGADGAILLAADPFDPSQGIGFNEDVVPAALRLVGKQGTLPSGHNSDGSGEGSTSSTDMNIRWAGGLRFDFPDTSWSGEAFYAHQRNIMQFPENQAESFSAVADGIAGRLGPNNDQYFNPFSTREHPCTNRVCDPTAFTQPGDPAFNTLFVMDEVSFQDETDWRNRFNVADIVFTGDVFDLPAGTVGMALGGQWRRVDLERDEGPFANACDRWVNACGFDFKKGRTTQAVFAEVAVPLMNHDQFGELDLSAAVRWEDSGGDLDSTDPKVGIRWSPRPFVALRASFGSSFIAPSLTQMFDSPVSFLENMVDPTCSLSGACVDSGSFRTQTFGGNEELQPEAADVWSAGLSLNLLDDRLSISFDYLYFDFQDRISRLRGQDVLDGDAQRFRPFLAGGGTREEWIDPVNKATGNFETQAIIRAPGGEIVEVLTQWVNAQTMKWKGWDLGVSYRWDGTDLPFVDREIGSFNFRIDGTYVQSYEFTLTGLPNETCGNPALGRRPPCEAAGSRNDRTSVVPPAPRIRANGQLNWLMGNHGATVFARYIHHVKEDSVFAAANPPLINSRVTYDAQYSYNIAGLIGGDASSTGVTVGCINCFDTRTDPMLTLGGLETFLHDPRGSMWYVRLSQSF